MHRLLYAAFALSGGAGLIYEAVWSRYLALLVGHSAYAQVLVIGTYLGGMAVGALAIGEAVKKIEAPLLWYVGAELGLALAGFLFHPVFQGATDLAFSRMIPAVGNPVLVGALEWATAVCLLIPQSILLGTTFPLMSSGILRTFRGAQGRTLSLLYFTNSAGGAVGVLAGGFLLVGAFGLPGSLATAAALNLMAAGFALTVHMAGWKGREAGRIAPGSLGDGTMGGVGEAHPEGGGGGTVAGSADGEAGVPPLFGEGPGADARTGLIRRLLLAVSFFTAVASFSYEIGWIRMLSLVMGSAAHSFEVMLSAFILGLALGALFIRGRADSGLRSLSLLGWIQWLMGLSALATLPLYSSTFEFMAFLVDALPSTDGGYLLFGIARYGIAIAIMLPSTIMAGMTLPLITATLLNAGAGEGSIGWVYGVNTLGSVLGVGVAGLLALPVLGLKGLILAGAGLDMGLGVLLLLVSPVVGIRSRVRWAGALALGVAALAGSGAYLGVEMDHRLLVSGVFRYGSIPAESEPVLFYRDGRIATVGVHLGEPGDLAVLTTNGKPDASISLRWIRAQSEVLPPQPILFDDEATQTLLALVPLAHSPRARSAALIGHGSGLTGHAVLASPYLQRAVSIEIEPEIIAASQLFYPANGRVFDDPRSSFVLDDARAYFAGSGERFDLIISEPSNPWVSGTSSLFTREFYQRTRGFLAPGGLFAQWFQCYEMTDSLVSSVVAAIDQVFPHYRGYLAGPSDILIVASGDVPLDEPDWRVFQLPAVRRMLAHVPPLSPVLLDALSIFDEGLLGPYLEAWEPVNSDFAPFLEVGAEKARFRKSAAAGYLGLGESRVSLQAAREGKPRGFTDGWMEPVVGLGPHQALSIGAWLRWARTRDISLDEAPTPRHAAALEAYRAYSLRLNLESPPPDWRRFMLLAVGVEGQIHGGTAGVADSLFYGRLFQYLRAQDAPLEARAVGDFLFGVAAWDHERTVMAQDILLAASARGEDWIPRHQLLEGGALAWMALGDLAGAREALSLLEAEETGREGAWVFRLELLRGLLREREAIPGGPSPG
jgi:predicted membrane-bound spermidine synthase